MMRRVFFMSTALVALLATAGPLLSQVTSNGFLVKNEAVISASPAKVYDVLIGQVGSWWDSDHTFSGNARNLSIDARPGGCFCEKFPDGGGVEHMRVVYAMPGAVLRMSGALGPLQASGIAGSLTWSLSSVSGGTKVELSYSVGGFVEGGFEKLAPAVQTVLRQQLLRLKSFIETGKPS